MTPESHGKDRGRIRLPITLPKPLYDWLREAAFREHRAMAELVRDAVTEYHDRRESQLTLPMSGGQDGE